MTTRADLERALAAAGCPALAQWDERTGSTNATARERAEAGAPEWTLVAAGHQTAGRGRLGRTWRDRPGHALMFSLVLRPAIDPEDLGLVALLAGAAVAEAATEVADVPVRCKWPNDLLRPEGKVGGILAESDVEDASVRYVVLGVGVNLDPPAEVEGATGLGGGVDAIALLTTFLRRFREGYRPGAGGFADAVLDRWSAVSATLGSEVEVLLGGDVRLHGVATGLDPRGGLIVATDAGPRVVTSGEVVHLRPAG